MSKIGCVYILANRKNGTIYVGSTTDLIGRVFEHKNKIYPNSFTAKYNVNKLMYFEWHNILENMVKREREIKEWKRYWKIKLIEDNNPNWNDLFAELLKDNGYKV